MKEAALVPLGEYLSTSYRPDRDYLDGMLVERNVGELDHSSLQTEIVAFFRSRRVQWNTYGFAAQRIEVSARRFRVPDICVVLGKPEGQIFREPPFICIEVLSKDDTLESTQQRIDDYLAFGVRYVWVINPRSRRAWGYEPDRIYEAKDGLLKTENPALELPLPDLFAEIDQ